MMVRVVWMLIAAAAALVMVYASRFWGMRLWDRDGLLGIEALRPQGKLVQQWLRGTDLAPFELLIWVAAGFLILTFLQKIYDTLTRVPEEDDHDG